jgi:hypothetical protein
MEKFELTLKSGPAISAHIANNHVMKYELALLNEMASAIRAGDSEKISWFAGFGDSFRQILMNVNEHRRALAYGFTEIAFNDYGWFASPKFLDREDIVLEQSEIRIGHGPNGLWAYALICNYGTAGSSGPLCVFCKCYPTRDAALTAAVDEMSKKMSQYLGNSDTTNYKQDVLHKTLKAIGLLKIKRVQLELF